MTTEAPSHEDLSRRIAAAAAYEELHVPALFEEWVDPVLDAARVDVGHRLLDVACGTGILARGAARRVMPGGAVTGVDPDPGMLAVAGEKEPTLEWRRGTADSLPFDDASFDVVVSQFGMMFFPDGIEAVREMRRVTVPGGRLAVAVWDSLDNSPAYATEVELLEQRAGSAAADALRAPFALGDRDALMDTFRSAGAGAVAVTTRTGRARFPSLRSMVEADLRGWLPVMGVELPEDLIETILEEAEEAMAEFVTADGRAVFDASAHIVTAVNA